MTFIAADWSIVRATKDIRYVGDDHDGTNPSYVSTIELHRALQSFADDAFSSGDDELDITDMNPSRRLGVDSIIELLNGYNIDDSSSEHIYNGSIIQDGGDTIYDGIQNFGNATNIQILQNGSVLTDDWWNTNDGLNSDSLLGVSHRFLLKVRDSGADIDGRRLIFVQRSFGTRYGEFSINGTIRGNNPVALRADNDLFNGTDESEVATWSDVVNLTEGAKPLDIDGDEVDEFYYSEWTRGTRTIAQAAERMKWLTRSGSTSTLYGLGGEEFRGITHQLSVGMVSGSFSGPERLSWLGGSGQLLASTETSTGEYSIFIQLLQGSPPPIQTAITGATSNAFATTLSSVEGRSISVPFFGVSTGEAIIGSYGLGFTPGSLSSADLLTDLSGSTRRPLDFATMTVSGLTESTGYLLVAPYDGTSLDAQGDPLADWGQLSLSDSLSDSGVTSITVSSPIPLDTPESGTIRVTLNSGRRRRVTYNSYMGSEFTINSTDFSGSYSASSGNSVAVTYIDTIPTDSVETFSALYIEDRQLVVLHRRGGEGLEREFLSVAVFAGGGTAVNVTRSSDA